MDGALPDAELKYPAISHRRATVLSGNHAPASASPVANMSTHGGDKDSNVVVSHRVSDSRSRTFRSKKAQQDTDQGLTTTHLGQYDPLYIEKVSRRGLSPNVKPKPQEIPMKLLIGAAMTDPSTDPTPEMLLPPETWPRPISHAQLAAEVKGIYAGLVMVEAKCVDVDEKQAIAAQEKDPARQTELSNEKWQALIALHRTLLYEHHDFFLASQHPSAGPALTRLAAQYSMPARMWRHGIHSFLEILRHRLPDSLDHMLAFIHIAYSMMALLYETVTAQVWSQRHVPEKWFEDAKVDDEERSLEVPSMAAPRVWSGVSRFWHSKAADRIPSVDCLYHHLAILARPISFEQFSFYTTSLTCTQPFITARSSIMTVFEPLLAVWPYRPVKTLSFLPNGAVRGLAFALSIRLASASSSGNDLSPALKTSREWPFGPSVPPFSSWPFAVSGMLLAGLSPLLARRLGPSRVSGTLMAVFGFVWLRINDDETTTPVVLWT